MTAPLVVQFDIHARDAAAQRQFYTDLFGWSADPKDEPSSYTWLFDPDGQVVWRHRPGGRRRFSWHLVLRPGRRCCRHDGRGRTPRRRQVLGASRVSGRDGRRLPPGSRRLRHPPHPARPRGPALRLATNGGGRPLVLGNPDPGGSPSHRVLRLTVWLDDRGSERLGLGQGQHWPRRRTRWRNCPRRDSVRLLLCSGRRNCGDASQGDIAWSPDVGGSVADRRAEPRSPSSPTPKATASGSCMAEFFSPAASG